MELRKLFETQKVLDERILKEHNLPATGNLDWKILALQVELGECANEWRGFKKWSKNQEPRTKDNEWYIVNDTIERHDDTCHSYHYATIKKLKNRNPLLEEYVDCLHFILSIGLELNMQYEELAIDSDYTRSTAIKTFNELYRVVAALETRAELGGRDDLVDLYEILLNLFVGLGEKFLGFTVDQMESAYFAKNEINHARQADGY